MRFNCWLEVAGMEGGAAHSCNGEHPNWAVVVYWCSCRQIRKETVGWRAGVILQRRWTRAGY